MGFRLIDDWHFVITRAWSVRLLIGAAVLSGLEVALNVLVAYQWNPGLPPGVFAGVAGIVSFLALIARFVAQKRDGDE